jgi:hypothetical protein
MDGRRPARAGAQNPAYRPARPPPDLEEFSDRGHSLTIDAGWPAAAELSLTWLSKQGL